MRKSAGTGNMTERPASHCRAIVDCTPSTAHRPTRDSIHHQMSTANQFLVQVKTGKTLPVTSDWLGFGLGVHFSLLLSISAFKNIDAKILSCALSNAVAICLPASALGVRSDK